MNDQIGFMGRPTHELKILTECQINALTGSMLGDGGLYKQKEHTNPKLVIHRTLKDKEYLEYEASIFKEFTAPRFENGVGKYTKLDERYNKYYSVWKYETVDTPSFSSYHKYWYPNGQKEVPNDLKLNGQIVAHWICDDGWVGKNKVDYRFQIDISTDGFTKDEVYFLSKLMSDRYNENIFVQPWTRKGTGKKYYKLRAYDSACRAIIVDVDDHFKMKRKRLWDNPISRYYTNPPERQIERNNITAQKKIIMDDFLKAGVDTLYSELSDRMQFKTDAGLSRWLKPLIEKNIIYTFYDRVNKIPLTIKFK